MITGYSDPLDVLLNLQRALDAHTGSGWLQNQTASQGPQGDEILAIIELPGVEKKDLQPKKTPSGFLARRPPITRRAVSTGASACSVISTGPCPCRSRSIRT